MAAHHQTAYYILQPITETNGSKQPNHILKCLKFMLKLYCNFAFHQQMAILSYCYISFTKEFTAYIDTVKSQFPSPSPLSCISFILYSNMSAIYPSYLVPHSLFRSLGLCTHSPSHYFLSPSSCRSSLGFGGSINISGLDTFIGHYYSPYPEQLLTHTYPSVQSVQLLWIWYVFVLGKGTVFLLIYKDTRTLSNTTKMKYTNGFMWSRPFYRKNMAE